MRTEDELLKQAIEGTLDVWKLTPGEAQILVDKLSSPNYGHPAGLKMQLGRGNADCMMRFRYVDLDGIVRENEVLDCHSMYSVHNLGFRNLSVLRLQLELSKFILCGSFPECSRESNNPYLIKALIQMRKMTGLQKFSPHTAGTATVEAALKAAKAWWHKKRGLMHSGQDTPIIISARNNFHGRTLGSISLSSNPSARNRYGPLAPALALPFGDYDLLENVIEHKWKNHTAAIILEPVQGEGGVNLPPPYYLEQVEKLCKKFDICLILDEIQTGFGRIGGKTPEELFAYQADSLSPDLVCFGKSAGGGVPFSFVGGRSEILDCLEEGTHGETFSGYSLGCIALDVISQEIVSKKLAPQSRERGEFMLGLLRDRFASLHYLVKNIRGRGLFIGLELEESFCTGKEFSYALLLEGVKAKETGENGQTIRFAPPLTISMSQITDCVSAVEHAIERIKKERERIRDVLFSQKKST